MYLVNKCCVRYMCHLIWSYYHLNHLLVLLHNERRLSLVAITHKKITIKFWIFGSNFKIFMRCAKPHITKNLPPATVSNHGISFCEIIG
jgi:hypothetical protein